MAENPYSPPTAAVRDPPLPPRSASVAVLAGIGVHFGGSLVSGAIVAMIYLLTLVAQGRSVEEFDPRQPGFGIGSFLIGGALSMLAGYVCARMVRQNERRVTTITATLSTAAVVLLALLVGLQLEALSMVSLGWSAVRLVATFLLIMIGGELGRRRNLADARKASAATAA